MAWKSLPHHRAVSRRWRGAHTVRASRTTHSCRIRSPRASPDEQEPRPSRTPRRLSARRRGVASGRRLAGDAVLDLSGDDVSERRASGGALHAFPATAFLYFGRRGIVPRCRRGVLLQMCLRSRRQRPCCQAALQYVVLRGSGASWASGAAQAAQFVRIILQDYRAQMPCNNGLAADC